MLEDALDGSVISFLRLCEARLVDTVTDLVVHPAVHFLRPRFLLPCLGGKVQPRVGNAFHVVERRVQDLNDLGGFVVDDRLGLL